MSRSSHSAARDPLEHTRAEYMSQGQLYRAIVTVPDVLSPDRNSLCERIVFFDCKSYLVPGPSLIELLALAWNTDTSDWRQRGLIYNVHSTGELHRDGLSDELWMRIYEVGGCGGAIHYCTADDVDLYVAPRMRKHMLDAIAALPKPAARDWQQ